MPAPHVSHKIEWWLRGAAICCASLFVVVLPFSHTTTLRLIALLLAASLTFVSGGWREVPRLPLLWAWAAWAFVAALSVVFARNPVESFGEFRNEVIYAFMAFATWFTLSQHREGVTWLARAVFAASVAALALGVVVFVSGSPLFDLGKYGDAGSLTTFLITVLPMLMLFALRAKPRSALRIGALALGAACLAAGALALNRTFWFAAAAEIIVFSLFSMRQWQRRNRGAYVLGGIAVITGLALVQVLSASQSKIALTAPGKEIVDFIVDDPRGDLWRFAITRIGEHPWVGAGIGKWVLRDAFEAHFHDSLLLHAHNVFLNRALETGLPGVVIFVALLASVVIAFWRLARSADARTAAVGAAGLALVVGVVAKSMTDDFFVRHNAILFWSLTGAALGTTSPWCRPAGAGQPVG
ncbi:MAG: O-antigen ligase family protein [Betaproteobacteria bacterium]